MRGARDGARAEDPVGDGPGRLIEDVAAYVGNSAAACQRHRHVHLFLDQFQHVFHAGLSSCSKCVYPASADQYAIGAGGH